MREKDSIEIWGPKRAKRGRKQQKILITRQNVEKFNYSEAIKGAWCIIEIGDAENMFSR
jgi:hypothetical protein